MSWLGRMSCRVEILWAHGSLVSCTGSCIHWHLDISGGLGRVIDGDRYPGEISYGLFHRCAMDHVWGDFFRQLDFLP